MKTCTREVYVGHQIVGHLLMAISSLTKFLLDFGAIVPATLSGTYYHKSPIVEGGLKV